MKVKIGDTVRFLNISGGGVITRVEGKLVFVEDQDGFEVPVLANEVVVMKDETKSTDKTAGIEEEVVEEQYEYVEEGDDSEPKFFIAFLSGEKSGVESGNLRVQLVNDSNYFAYYTISNIRSDAQLDLLFNGLIEPNTKISLDKMTVLQVDDRQWKVNLMLFKKNKGYLPQFGV